VSATAALVRLSAANGALCSGAVGSLLMADQ